MSATLQLIVLVAAAIGALGYILFKVVVPGAQLITDAKMMLPYLKFLPMLAEITAQFGPDSGQTIKDQMNRVEQHAQEVAEANARLAKEIGAANRSSITEIQAALGAMRELAREDRQALLDILRSGMRMEAASALADESRARMEASGERVEASGVRTEAADAVVAEDLAETRKRADEVHEDEAPGSAADAASQSPEE